MAYLSSICLEKNLIAVKDKSSVKLFDTKKNELIQTHLIKNSNITNFELKLVEETVFLIVSDNQGQIHCYNINKNELITKVKIHEGEIMRIKVIGNIIYSLSKGGIKKAIIHQNNLDISDSIKINLKKDQSISNFDVDPKEKYLIYSVGNKIKLHYLKKKETNDTTILNYSHGIHILKFSDDGKFILSNSSEDNFIHIFPIVIKNGLIEKSSQTIPLSINFSATETHLIQVDKDILHAFAWNRENLHILYIELNSWKEGGIIKPKAEITFESKDLISMTPVLNNTYQSLFIVYGHLLSQNSLITKTIKYSKNSKNIKELVMKINSKTEQPQTSHKDPLPKTDKYTVLNEIQINDNQLSTDNTNSIEENEFRKILHSKQPKHELMQKLTSSKEKISLFNIIKNSVINNDHQTFEWALDQKDSNIIEETVKQFDNEILTKFLAKFIDLFQSNVFYKRNIISWLTLLFKYHFFTILTLDKTTLENLKRIQTLIDGRTKNLNKLIEVEGKLGNLINIFSTTSKTTLNSGEIKPAKEKQYEPLLIYNESDSEEENQKKINEKLKKKNIKKTDNKSFSQKLQEGEDVEMDEDEMIMADDEIYNNEDFDEMQVDNEEQAEDEDDEEEEVDE
jgi:hypothetical protein